MDLKAHEYLGDGVYAGYDGWHIWLMLGDHRSDPLIALEPAVMKALNDYAARVWGQKERDASGFVTQAQIDKAQPHPHVPPC